MRIVSPAALMSMAAGLTMPCTPARAVTTADLPHLAGVATRAVPSSGTTAETYLWKPVAIGAGGFITGYSTDNSGITRVVRADVYGAYLWVAQQGRWAQLVTSESMPANMQMQGGANEGVFEIVVAPSKPDRIYMAFKGAVFRSDNRGLAFDRTSPIGAKAPAFDANSEFRLYGPFMAVAPGDPDLVLFGTPENGLWRSADAGAHWTRVPSVPSSADLRPAAGIQSPGTIVWFAPGGSPAGARIWAMSAGHGVFASTDGGNTFAPLPNTGSSQPRTLRQGTFAPDGSFFGVDSETQSVWHYRNGAWVDLTGRFGLSARRFAAVAVNPRNSQIIVIDEGGKTFRSTDGGRRWWPMWHRARVGEGDPPWLRLNDKSYFALGRVQFDPVVPNRLWVGAGTGVYYADIPDIAPQITWTSQTRGIEELVANDVIKPPGQAPLFAGWDFGIHVKDDLDAFSTTYGPKERLLISAQQLAWTPANPAFVVTNASDANMSCCSEDGDAVLAGFSTNGGRSWSKFATLPQPPGTSRSDPWRMSFGTIAVAADDIDNIVWEPTFQRSPYFTQDRGATWTRVVLPGEKLPLTGSHSALHYSRKTLAADRVLPGTFYLVHSGDGANPGLAGLWVTQDHGTRWRRVFEGEIAPASRYAAKLRAVPGFAGHLFFTSGTYGGDTHLRRSIDGGKTWRVLNDVDQVEDIAFGRAAPGSGYPTLFVAARVGGSYGIWRSIDNAASWQRVGRFPMGSLDQVTVIEGDPDLFGRVYLGFKGSGWIYGGPSTCVATAYRFATPSDCSAVSIH
jgi:photosystem II stability/assembly factor-like uncharacterized protein